jgi:hypothetical protein
MDDVLAAPSAPHRLRPGMCVRLARPDTSSHYSGSSELHPEQDQGVVELNAGPAHRCPNSNSTWPPVV